MKKGKKGEKEPRRDSFGDSLGDSALEIPQRRFLGAIDGGVALPGPLVRKVIVEDTNVPCRYRHRFAKEFSMLLGKDLKHILLLHLLLQSTSSDSPSELKIVLLSQPCL